MYIKCTHPEDGNLSPLIEAEFLRTLNLVCNFFKESIKSKRVLQEDDIAMQLNCSLDVLCFSFFFR